MAQNQKSKKRTETTRIVTTGNTVRIESPKSHGRQGRQKVSVIVAPDQVVGGFISFLREHAIVGLAVGFVIATQVQTIVKQLVASFIDPAFKLLFGQDLELKSFFVHHNGKVIAFGWGALVYTLLDFLFVLIAVYAVIKLFSLDKLDKPLK